MCYLNKGERAALSVLASGIKVALVELVYERGVFCMPVLYIAWVGGGRVVLGTKFLGVYKLCL